MMRHMPAIPEPTRSSIIQRPLRRRTPAHRTPDRHPARSPRHRLHRPPHRIRTRTRTLTPTNLRSHPLSWAGLGPVRSRSGPGSGLVEHVLALGFVSGDGHVAVLVLAVTAAAELELRPDLVERSSSSAAAVTA